jgi:hypothetical protein
MHQKGAVFDPEKICEGGQEGLHGMEGRGGAAMMTNPSLLWRSCHQEETRLAMVSVPESDFFKRKT